MECPLATGCRESREGKGAIFFFPFFQPTTAPASPQTEKNHQLFLTSRFDTYQIASTPALLQPSCWFEGTRQEQLFRGRK